MLCGIVNPGVSRRSILLQYSNWRVGICEISTQFDGPTFHYMNILMFQVIIAQYLCQLAFHFWALYYVESITECSFFLYIYCKEEEKDKTNNVK